VLCLLAAGSCTECANKACSDPWKQPSGVCNGTTNGFTCTDYAGKCTNGVLLTGVTLRRQDNHCGTCSDGFYLVDRMCQPHKSCPPDQYLSDSSPTAAGSCKMCSKISCAVTGTYRTGSCSGTNDGYSCNACTNVMCPSGQYRSGFCSGASNQYTCQNQPTCGKGKYLNGANNTTEGSCETCHTCKSTRSQLLYEFIPCTAMAQAVCKEQTLCPLNQYLAVAGVGKKGSCTTCSNSDCASGKFRSGSCSRTNNGYVCSDHASCPGGQYLKGSSNSDKGVCTACSNINCTAKFEDRTGYCSGTTDGFKCVTFAGKCEGGKLAPVEDRSRENHCGECNKGYWLDDSASQGCVRFEGGCQHGDDLNLVQRTANGQCAQCYAGYSITPELTCIETYTGCIGGESRDPSMRKRNNQCISCDASRGYTLAPDVGVCRCARSLSLLPLFPHRPQFLQGYCAHDSPARKDVFLRGWRTCLWSVPGRLRAASTDQAAH
jgi:hypothetical protein